MRGTYGPVVKRATIPESLVRALSREQSLLALDAPAIAAERAVGSDDPVTGDHQRRRVGRAGARHGPRGARPADRPGDLRVRAGAAVRDLAERFTHALLERGRADVSGASCRAAGGPAHTRDWANCSPRRTTLDSRGAPPAAPP